MNNRTSTYLAVLIGVICVFFIIHLSFSFFANTRTVRNDVVQGILIGFGLAFVTAQIYARIKATKVNGWITMFGFGEPGNGMLLRAAYAQIFPGPVNVPQEAMYWWTNVRRWRGPYALRSSTTTSCTSRRAVFRPTMHSGR